MAWPMVTGMASFSSGGKSATWIAFICVIGRCKSWWCLVCYRSAYLLRTALWLTWWRAVFTTQPSHVMFLVSCMWIQSCQQMFHTFCRCWQVVSMKSSRTETIWRCLVGGVFCSKWPDIIDQMRGYKISSHSCPTSACPHTFYRILQIVSSPGGSSWRVFCHPGRMPDNTHSSLMLVRLAFLPGECSLLLVLCAQQKVFAQFILFSLSFQCLHKIAQAKIQWHDWWTLQL